MKSAIAATLASVTLAQSVTADPTEQDHFWAYTDMALGAFLGVYLPINTYARNGDCYSSVLGNLTTLFSYHTYFDSDFDEKPVVFGLKLAW